MSDSPRILHVDDDDDIREIALIALETVGDLTVMQAASGEEALSVIGGFQPDLLLLDVMMPEMTGDTLLSKIREVPNFAEVPTIFMTAKARSEDVAHLMKLGALEVIAKPFDPMTLADQITAIWDRRQT